MKWKFPPYDIYPKLLHPMYSTWLSTIRETNSWGLSFSTTRNNCLQQPKQQYRFWLGQLNLFFILQISKNRSNHTSNYRAYHFSNSRREIIWKTGKMNSKITNSPYLRYDITLPCDLHPWAVFRDTRLKCHQKALQSRHPQCCRKSQQVEIASAKPRYPGW